MNKNITLTICDLCKEPIQEGNMYFRIDQMIKAKVTYHKQRNLKHFCFECARTLFYGEKAFNMILGVDNNE